MSWLYRYRTGTVFIRASGFIFVSLVLLWLFSKYRTDDLALATFQLLFLYVLAQVVTLMAKKPQPQNNLAN